MADSYEFSVNWGALDDILPELSLLASRLGPRDFPEFARAAEAISAEAERKYVAYLLGEPTPAGKAMKRPSQGTAKAVTRTQTAALGWMIANKAPMAKTFEEGHDAYDEKATLFNGTSKRARRGKEGQLYLIIPFRHGVPGTRGMPAMSKDVYAMAKKMQFSRELGPPSTRTSATGWVVPRWTYRWNGRLTEKQLAAIGIGGQEGSRMSGMVRMAKSGHTSYMTFRVMSTKSPASSWVRPAQPGLFLLGSAVDTAMAEGMPMLEDAILADLRGALGASNDSLGS